MDVKHTKTGGAWGAWGARVGGAWHDPQTVIEQGKTEKGGAWGACFEKSWAIVRKWGRGSLGGNNAINAPYAPPKVASEGGVG